MPLPTYVSKPVATRSVSTIDLDSTGVWLSGHNASDSKLAREAEAAERPGSSESASGARPAPRRRAEVSGMRRTLSIVLLGGLVAALLTPVPSYAVPSYAQTPAAPRADPTRGRARHAGELHRHGVPEGGGEGRHDHLRLRPQPGHDRHGQAGRGAQRRDRKVVIDGGGLVTLSGDGKHRILYQNTCDKRLVWTTSHCNDQATPKLVLRNLTFTRGDSTGSLTEGGGGGAVFVRGGRLSVMNSTVHPATAATRPAPTSAAPRSGCSTSSATSR